MRLILQTALATVLASLVASPATADDAVELTDYATFVAPAGDAARIAPDLADYYDVDYNDDHGEYIVLLDADILVSEQTVTEVRTVISRYQTTDQINDDGNALVYVNPFSSTVTIDEAYVVQPDGEVVGVDPDTIQVQNDPDDDVFGDYMVLTIPWPSLQIGSTVTLRTTSIVDKNRRAVPWSRRFYLRTYNYTHDYRVRVAWDNDALEPAWYNGSDRFQCQRTQARELTCHDRAVPGLDLEDSVNYYDVLPQLFVGPDLAWADISTLLSDYMEQAIVSSPEVQQTAARLIADADDDRARLQRIHGFVASQIRYVAFEHGFGSHVPRPSDVTLKRRYGDCKDMTALLLDLLRQADIEASPVYVATTRSAVEPVQLPSANHFNHVIACGALSDGTTFCLDPTDPHSGSNYDNPWMQGLVSFTPGKNAVPKLLPRDEHRWELHETMHMDLDGDGNLHETLSITYVGPYASSIRSRLSGLTRKELERWALDTYQTTVSDRVEPDFDVSGVREIEDNIEVQSTAVFEELVDTNENLDYSEDATWLADLVGYFENENEVYAYDFEGLRYVGRISMTVDDAWKLRRSNPTVRFDSPFGTVRRTEKRDGNTVQVDTEVLIAERSVSLDEAEDFNAFLKNVEEYTGFKVKAIKR